MPDVVGLDGAWVNDFAKQGAITDLSALMAEANYDECQLASQVKVDGQDLHDPGGQLRLPAVHERGPARRRRASTQVPTNRTEFLGRGQEDQHAGRQRQRLGPAADTAVPNGIQNDVMSWLWASGGTCSRRRQARPTDPATVKSTVEYVKSLNDAGVIAPGSLTMKEQDKVEKFTNGQVGMMIDSLAHINLIKKNNPDLNFRIAPIPAEDGYTGKRGIPYASWGIGIADSSEHKAEAFKLVAVPDEPGGERQAEHVGERLPGQQHRGAGLRQERPAVQDRLRDLPGGVPGQRVHRPAEVRRADAYLR